MGKPTPAAKKRADRRYYERHRELLLYEKRVRYNQTPIAERTAENREAYRRRRADPEKRAHDQQRETERERKRLERRSRVRGALFTMGLSIIDLEEARYTVIDARGKRTLEVWPPQDEAERLIEFAETLEKALGHRLDAVSTKGLDTAEKKA